jgi:methylmalonyl-CoA mutase N-terminal domain/subunit
MDKERAAEKLSEAYREGQADLKTPSGLEVKEFYAPEDTPYEDYKKDVGDPGEYPYTRGIHRNMFRGRYWTRREVCGFGSAKDTNERLRFQIEEGASGLSVILDNPGMMGLDADHPMADKEVGMQGASISTLDDMRDLLDGIPMEKVSLAWNVATSTMVTVLIAQYLVVAEERGISPASLRGTVQNDPIHVQFCGYQPAVPIDLSVKLAVDAIEYCTQHMPLYYTGNVNLYDMRENGIDAVQEVAFGFSIAKEYVRKALERDLDIDDFAPRRAFYCSSHLDFFEEVAKLRAARRLWARIMKDEFGAKDPRSLQFRFGVHTAGCSLVPQQPLNNSIRVAYQALAAVLAGVQSLHCCSYDEPMALPTEESQRLAIRTQQILAYETGVARVSDPLGGSYYVESLTEQIEEEAAKLIAQIDDMGGMIQAVKSGWVGAEIEKAALTHQREVDRGERVVVGVNKFQSEPELVTPGGVHRASYERAQEVIAKVRRAKESRDQPRALAAVALLRENASLGEKENLMPYIIEGVKADLTAGEIIGVIREAWGLHYDPLEMRGSPFDQAAA